MEARIKRNYYRKAVLTAVILIAVISLAVIGFLIYTLWKEKAEQIWKECESDSDCVPSSCCHATSCTSKEKAPDCRGVFCTQICSGPLDCGAGHCGCIKGKCKVVKSK